MNYQNEQEFKTLFSVVEQQKPRYILEIGSMWGETLLPWMMLRPTILISIDQLVPKEDSRYAKQKAFHDGIWKEEAEDNGIDFHLFEDSHDPRVLEQVRSIVPYLDFLFIDGDHSYEGVKLDYEMYSPLVKKWGLIAFHDIVPNFSHGEIEVPRYWNQLKANKLYREILFDHGQYGIGLLVR